MCLLSCSLNTTLCAPHSLKEEEEARGQKPRPHFTRPRRGFLGRIKESLLFLSSQKRLYEGTEKKRNRERRNRRGRYEAD